MKWPEEQLFRFSCFGPKRYMFGHGSMGVVIEKRRSAVCVYGTAADFSVIRCAFPVGKYSLLKSMPYTVRFWDDQIAGVSIGDKIKIWIDYASKRMANNFDFTMYGHGENGETCALPWSSAMELYFWKRKEEM